MRERSCGRALLVPVVSAREGNCQGPWSLCSTFRGTGGLWGVAAPPPAPRAVRSTQMRSAGASMPRNPRSGSASPGDPSGPSAGALASWQPGRRRGVLCSPPRLPCSQQTVGTGHPRACARLSPRPHPLSESDPCGSHRPADFFPGVRWARLPGDESPHRGPQLCPGARASQGSPSPALAASACSQAHREA